MMTLRTVSSQSAKKKEVFNPANQFSVISVAWPDGECVMRLDAELGTCFFFTVPIEILCAINANDLFNEFQCPALLFRSFCICRVNEFLKNKYILRNIGCYRCFATHVLYDGH